jgi:hypothetical protein
MHNKHFNSACGYLLGFFHGGCWQNISELRLLDNINNISNRCTVCIV